MAHVFISYSRGDRKNTTKVNAIRIDTIFERLRAAGVDIWIAPDSIPTGAEWQDALTEGLQTASAYLMLVSSRFIKATGMKREMGTALANGLPVVVALLDEDAETLIPQEVANAPRIALFHDFDAGMTALIDALPHPAMIRKRDASAAVTIPQADIKPEPQSKGYVFISYAEEDDSFVAKLRAYFKERGYGYWDYREQDRNYHTQIFLELEEVIQNATATISVLSPDWKKSAWATKEYMYSDAIAKPIFLVMARLMEPTLVIQGIPYIDFTLNENAGFERLDKALRRKGLIE